MTKKVSLFDALKDEGIRKILRIVETTPKKTSEITKQLDESPSIVASQLRILELCEAVTFEENKWKATNNAINTLNKYYGNEKC